MEYTFAIVWAITIGVLSLVGSLCLAYQFYIRRQYDK